MNCIEAAEMEMKCLTHLFLSLPASHVRMSPCPISDIFKRPNQLWMLALASWGYDKIVSGIMENILTSFSEGSKAQKFPFGIWDVLLTIFAHT